MRINNKMLHDISDMVKISCTDEEESRLIKDLNQLVEFIDTMDKMVTDNEEPLAYIHPNKNIYREDLSSDILAEEELDVYVPESMDGYYVVPRILE